MPQSVRTVASVFVCATAMCLSAQEIPGQAQTKPATPVVSGSSTAASERLQPNLPNASELRKKIEAALHNEPSLSGSNLALNITDIAIEVTGNAGSNQSRIAARRIVQSFAGNRHVIERIHVPGAATNVNASKAESPTQAAPNLPAKAPAAAMEQKPAQQNLNRPITDPARDGDKSDIPR